MYNESFRQISTLPTTVIEPSILWVCATSFCSLVPSFARIDAKLTKTLSNQQQQTSDTFAIYKNNWFKDAESEASENPILPLRLWQLVNTVATNAYNKAVRCFLLYNQPSSADRQIGYWSHFYINTDGTYKTSQGQGPSVKWAILLLQFYSQVCLHTVCTNH